MSSLETFCRQIRSRSIEHQKAMKLLSSARLAGQMVAILRQELDSMVRVIYLLAQPLDRRAVLIEAAVSGKRWSKLNSKALVTDREMVDLSQQLQGWARSVYKFGCAFIHLSYLHDYNDRDPLYLVSNEEKDDIIQHCRHYHGGPDLNDPTFGDIVKYLPNVLDKISSNLNFYLDELQNNSPIKPIN